MAGPVDRALRERASAVIPGGMYGHQSAACCRRLPAVHAGRPRGAGLGRGRQRVRRPDVQLRPGRARPPAPGRRGGRRRARPELGDCQNAPGPVMVELAELLVATVAARRLGDVRQERHRRDHDVLHDRPRADRPGQDPGGPRAPTTAPRRGARRARPGRPRPTGPTSATSPTTTWPASAGRAAEAGRRPGRHPGQPVQARRRLRPGAGRPGVRPRAARAVRRRRARR